MRSTIMTLTRRFAEQQIDHALIGGVALVMHGIQRTTQDLDFIVSRDAADRADATMVEIGFERLNRGEIFGNYLLGPLRVDLLFTKGIHSQRMLERAKVVDLEGSGIKLVATEDLIGLKLQALANNPERPMDRADIDALLRRFGKVMDMALVREYFVLFDREAELDGILETIQRRDRGDPPPGG